MNRLLINIAKLAVLVSICLVSACATQKKITEEEKAAHRTAKINAQLGITYLENNNIQRAKQKLLLAIDQAPDIPEPWYSMGYFFEATGNAELANTHYLKAIAVSPTRGDSQNNYGTFLCRAGKYQEANKHFMLAVNDRDYLDPADAYENAGLCEMQVPNRMLAINYFKKALAEDARRPVSLQKLAQLEYDGGRYKSADYYLNEYFKTTIEPTQKSKALSAKVKTKLGQGSLASKRLALMEHDTEADTMFNELLSQVTEVH